MSERPTSGVGAWFPSGKNEELGWRLDVVTLLAVIGESAMLENAQALTATPFCLIPRIIPAPQALLKASRPTRLPSVAARMTGVYSGVDLESVGFFANILHPLDQLQPFAFRVYEIEHTDRNTAGNVTVVSPATERPRDGGRRVSIAGSMFGGGPQTPTVPPPMSPRIPRGPPTEESTMISNKMENETMEADKIDQKDTGKDSGTGTLMGTTKRTANSRSVDAPPPIGLVGRKNTVRFATEDENVDVEAQQPSEDEEPKLARKMTRQRTFQDFINYPTLAQNDERPAVPAKAYSPINILSVFSFLQTALGIALSTYWRDGTAIVALATISAASSVVGYASWWKPLLMNRSHTNRVPRGDVVIRTREGAFILVKCTEEVARELYSGTEECEYRVADRSYRGLMALGTFLLMVSVVLMGNCRWNSQVYIGGSYVLLNGLYWGMGMLDKKKFWDLNRYKVTEVTPEDSQLAHTTTDRDDQREGVKSFTRTLWYAIRETRLTGWCTKSGAAPDTDTWREWLGEAEIAAKNGQRQWTAVERKNVLMKKKLDQEKEAMRRLRIPPSYDPSDEQAYGRVSEVPDGQQAPAEQVRQVVKRGRTEGRL
ncbi:uncharacterized protein MKZ38_004222 [Zalerion maritima]|uniref:Uncharacterized protein n=1 Tax=Zalerion maritima TaxID=339359 RepID=A0AAD5RMA9_9PEZI|nr:uncharacterized protein MKZ38_004222 [Zalerion maritima]